MIFHPFLGPAAVHCHALLNQIRLGLPFLKRRLQLLHFPVFVNFIKFAVSIVSRTALIGYDQSRSPVIGKPGNRKTVSVVRIRYVIRPYVPVLCKQLYLPLCTQNPGQAVRIIYIGRPAIRKTGNAVRQPPGI